MSAAFTARSALLEVQHISHHYKLPRQRLFGPPPQTQVLDDICFSVLPGQSLGIVGESGSGKSTLARIIMALERPSSGRVRLLGRDLNAMEPHQLQLARADFQMVFQDPYSSLDPRQRIERIVTEPLHALGHRDRATLREKAEKMLQRVGLHSRDLDKYPHEFSGGQRQRIAIARALMTHPRLIVADEPVSALDVTIQAQVLDLMLELKTTYGISFLLISHDMAAIHHLCEDMLVMHQGKVVEKGSPSKLFHEPTHPYTQALVCALPQLGQGRRRLRLQQQAKRSQASPLPPPVTTTNDA
ncbi:ABC transporter ATP-binding protein [Lampropedia puyangensis]|uniref:ABC transporter ATP-binding protein n=1 Tax=Lampropedia puyangensis TaxID=1330072 RepID=A0A4S8F155_9BURK|nr:ATP-binding cassette domain-containing protein [Lampropedia puyangensis]THU01008.1 ABC transporter ATP-binding protein [Lampropedia puyangensis]